MAHFGNALKFITFILTLSSLALQADEHLENSVSCAQQVVGVLPSYTTQERQLLQQRKFLANLPTEQPVSYISNHRYHYLNKKGESTPETIFSALPMPKDASEKLEDFAKRGFKDPLPRRFLVGDGSITRVIVGIDLTAGSPLSRAIERIQRILRIAYGPNPSDETIIKAMSENVFNQLGIAASGGFEWDRKIPYIPPTKENFDEKPLNHAPVDEGFSLPIVPLENYLELNEGYCLQQALMAWLVLRAFDIPARMHFGVNGTAPLSITGHSSVELEDGRIVDPAGKMVITPQDYNTGLRMLNLVDTDWQFTPGYKTYVGNAAWITWRLRLKYYPVLVLEP